MVILSRNASNGSRITPLSSPNTLVRPVRVVPMLFVASRMAPAHVAVCLSILEIPTRVVVQNAFLTPTAHPIGHALGINVKIPALVHVVKMLSVRS